MSKLKVQEVKNKLGADGGVCFIDVRSVDEFKSGHVPGARCVPLDQIEMNPDLIPKDQIVILGCQSGMRSNKAYQLLTSKGFENVAELEGGFSAWKASGEAVSKVAGAPIPLFRQVLIAAGLMEIAFVGLGILVHSGFLVAALFVGAGLVFAGTTGKCGLAILLGKMPWNRGAL